MEAAVRCRLQRDSLSGLRVAVQGIGNVGYYLCSYLHDAGARLVVSDIDDVRAHRACKEFSATAVDPDDILLQDVDVVAPCALGAVLNETSIPLLRAPIVAGGANNQLASDTDGQRLSNAGILYAPDYVINGGGIINVACEYYGNCSEAEVLRQVDAIGPRLEGIFEQSQQSGRPTNEIADEQARQLIRNPD
jgi:leucine dehydrogenase